MLSPSYDVPQIVLEPSTEMIEDEPTSADCRPASWDPRYLSTKWQTIRKGVKDQGIYQTRGGQQRPPSRLHPRLLALQSQPAPPRLAFDALIESGGDSLRDSETWSRPYSGPLEPVSDAEGDHVNGAEMSGTRKASFVDEVDAQYRTQRQKKAIRLPRPRPIRRGSISPGDWDTALASIRQQQSQEQPEPEHSPRLLLVGRLKQAPEHPNSSMGFGLSQSAATQMSLANQCSQGRSSPWFGSAIEPSTSEGGNLADRPPSV